MLLLQGFIALPEFGGEHVSYPEPVPSGLVHVGRAYALEGGAYLGFALRGLAGGVQHPVGGEDELGPLRNLELAGDGPCLGLDCADFIYEDDRIHHDPVAYDVHGVFPEDSGRHRVEHESVSVELEGMAGVRPSLEACYYLVVGSEHVHDLTFALVAPLEPEHYIKFLHLIEWYVISSAAAVPACRITNFKDTEIFRNGNGFRMESGRRRLRRRPLRSASCASICRHGF